MPPGPPWLCLCKICGRSLIFVYVVLVYLLVNLHYSEVKWSKAQRRILKWSAGFS